MDSLLASYASSDEEEEETQPPSKPSSSSSSLLSSLPKPKSNSISPSPSLLRSLPLASHGNDGDGEQEASKSAIKPSQAFSNLPPPKSHNASSNLSSPLTNPKRVVQFKPPIIPYSLKSSELNEEDDEEEDRERERRRRSEAESSSQGKSFLSFMPAPRYSVSLGVLPSSGSGRRAIIDTEVSPAKSSAPTAETDTNTSSNTDADLSSENYAQYYAGNFESGSDPNAGNYGYRESYSSGYSDGGYAGYGSYGVEASVTPTMESPSAIEIAIKAKGKRGRSEIPKDIIEVKQDELMKNRPREDQVKSTGIAFGPSYQPASTKGKPSKLHKRKHQIGSLYFDMRAKEAELAERRSRGFLTKAETHAKYGW